MSVESGDRDVLSQKAERLSSLKGLGVPSPDEVAPPLHWPSLSASQVRVKFPQLRDWVDGLRARYEDDMDVHVVPLCWFRHESMVGALQALKDHERSSYGTMSPAAAGTDWHRAYRDITALLRQFTMRAGCGADHRDAPSVAGTPEETFAEFVNDEANGRRERAVAMVMDMADFSEHVDEWGEIT